MGNESILISEVIPAAPERIYNAWLDSAEHSAFTGSPAAIDPEIGGAHTAFDGYIRGRTLELRDGSRIVQSWRTDEFPAESQDSRLEITFEQTLGGTLVTLLHTDIPPGQSDRYRVGWNEYYLARMKNYFTPTTSAPAPTKARAKAKPKARATRNAKPKLKAKTKAQVQAKTKAKAKAKAKTKTKAKAAARQQPSSRAKPASRGGRRAKKRR